MPRLHFNAGRIAPSLSILVPSCVQQPARSIQPDSFDDCSWRLQRHNTVARPSRVELLNLPLRWPFLTWAEASGLAKDWGWRTNFFQQDKRRRQPPASDKFAHQGASSPATMALTTSSFTEQDPAPAQELSAPATGSKAVGRLKHMDPVIRVETSRRPGYEQAKLSISHGDMSRRDSTVRGQGADGRSQKPSQEQVQALGRGSQAADSVVGRLAVWDHDPGSKSDGGGAAEQGRVAEACFPSRTTLFGTDASGGARKRHQTCNPSERAATRRRLAGPAARAQRAEWWARASTGEKDEFVLRTNLLDISVVFCKRRNYNPKEAIYNTVWALGRRASAA